jgi:hypothetical protein
VSETEPLRIDGRKKGWTPEQRKAQSDRIKKAHAEGKYPKTNVESLERRIERQAVTAEFEQNQTHIQLMHTLRRLMSAHKNAKKAGIITKQANTYMALLRIELAAVKSALALFAGNKPAKKLLEDAEKDESELDELYLKMKASEDALAGNEGSGNDELGSGVEQPGGDPAGVGSDARDVAGEEVPQLDRREDEVA